MRPFLVGGSEPLPVDLTQLVGIREHASIEHLFVPTAVNAVDAGVLVGHHRLDVAKFNSPELAPSHELGREQLWAIVWANWVGSPTGSAR